MAVRIRMTKMGRKHRPYFRIVAIEGRNQRDGKYLEDLGTYDPMKPNTDERVTLKPSRIKHWISVGAQPSEKVAILLKKYMEKFEKAEAEGASAAKEQPASEESSGEEATAEG